MTISPKMSASDIVYSTSQIVKIQMTPEKIVALIIGKSGSPELEMIAHVVWKDSPKNVLVCSYIKNERLIVIAGDKNVFA